MNKSIINITSIALKKLKMIITENNMKAIRLSLKTGGCNGFEYNLEPTLTLEKGDEYFSKDGVNVYICSKSLLYLVGTNIDWKKNIMGETFVFSNPNATSKCGCGSSFGA
jgi:iron-sulfur cluster assembly protein